MASLCVQPLPVYRTDEIRRIESLAHAELDGPPLMERAGAAAADLARALIAGSRAPVLVLAGPGNNGGDAFVVARHLKEAWHRVSVVFTGEQHKLSSEASAAFEAWNAAGGETLTSLADGGARHAALIVDGLFGIGLERDLTGRYADLVGAVNASGTAVLALDIPSGLHADSGRVLGCAVTAQHTATFIALKPGLLTLDGPDHCGHLHVRDLGLDLAKLVAPRGMVIASGAVATVLPRRTLNSHKGTFGSVGIVGGAAGMSGAALLAGRAALQLGAGRVYLGFLDRGAPSLDPMQPELMLRGVEEVLAMDGLSCLVLGPGLSQAAAAERCTARALELPLPLIIDADALNLIGAHPHLQQACRSRTAPTVMTPHPAEAARLMALSSREIQHDRIASALALAQRYRAITVLKGVGSVIATSDGNFDINTSGNPGLASAGMGDVLSGMLGALVGQGAEPVLATCAAVHLHGLAADRLVEQHGGPLGISASEVSATARALLNQAIYNSTNS
jgi:hydroxyethylthiazole kinase-like uncharacterized protein yjeF